MKRQARLPTPLRAAPPHAAPVPPAPHRPVALARDARPRARAGRGRSRVRGGTGRAAGRLGWAEAGAGLLALLFAPPLLRPALRQPPVSLVANPGGLYVLHGCAGREHVVVPRHGVGAMSVRRVASGNGVLRAVVIGIRGGAAFWEPARASRFMPHPLPPVAPDGTCECPLPSPLGVAPEAMLAALVALRDRSSPAAAVEER